MKNKKSKREKIKDIDQRTLGNLSLHLSTIECSLRGVAALLWIADGDCIPLSSENLQGLGKNIKLHTDELRKIVGVLTDGLLVKEFDEFASEDDRKRKKNNEHIEFKSCNGISYKFC